jgi:hypothetical protein
MSPTEVELPSSGRRGQIVLMAICLAMCCALGSYAWVQVSSVRAAYRGGWDMGHHWRSVGYAGHCADVASRMYPSDATLLSAYQAGCVDGLRGNPELNWSLTGYSSGD